MSEPKESQHFHSRGWHEARYFFVALHILRVPIVLAAFILLALTLPQQTIEIYRAIAQDLERLRSSGWANRGLEVGLGACIFILVSFTIWFASVQLSQSFRNRIPSNAAAGNRLLDWGPAFLALAPFVGLAIGIVLARVPENDGLYASILEAIKIVNQRKTLPLPNIAMEGIALQMLEFNTYLLVGAAIAIIIAAFILFIIIIGTPVATVWLRRSGSRLSSYSVAFLIYGFVIVAIAVFTYNPIALPKTIGIIAVSGCFFICLTVILSRISYWSDISGIPFLSIAIFLAFLFSALNLNDNHEIRKIYTASGKETITTATESLSLKQAFSSWYQTRPDRNVYEDAGRRYPVYIVAAQGGGIYAAFHAASLLGSAQDFCPRFRDHLFSISSVSGGSVGAAYFASLSKMEQKGLIPAPTSQACKFLQESNFSYANAAEVFFGTDLLSPLITATLFPDFFQRFWVRPIPTFDRARSLEYSLIDAWDSLPAQIRSFPSKASHQNPWKASYTSLWLPDQSIPALLLNTTEVDSGERRVIAPFFLPSHIRQFPLENNCEHDPESGKSDQVRASDISLSTAAVLSARFPWVTPSGWYRYKSNCKPTNHKTMRLVDGGYFENSGVATARDLIIGMLSAIQNTELQDKIEIRLIVLSGEVELKDPATSFEEFISPVRALLNARSSRAQIAIRAASREFDGNRLQDPTSPDPMPFVQVHVIELQENGYPFPLGWRLSELTRTIIQAQNGDHRRCSLASADGGEAQATSVAADCIKALLKQDLDVK